MTDYDADLVALLHEHAACMQASGRPWNGEVFERAANRIELIAAATREAVGAERERCARIAEREWTCRCSWETRCDGCVKNEAGQTIAKRIRSGD